MQPDCARTQDSRARAQDSCACSGVEKLVCRDISARQALGLRKYGTSLAESPLPLSSWLQHAYEEALDLANYLKRAILETEGRGPQTLPAASLDAQNSPIDAHGDGDAAE